MTQIDLAAIHKRTKEAGVEVDRKNLADLAVSDPQAFSDLAKLAKSKRNRRHWKTKMWKRRSAMRQAKAEAFRLAGEN